MAEPVTPSRGCLVPNSILWYFSIRFLPDQESWDTRVPALAEPVTFCQTLDYLQSIDHPTAH
jgi:hypothetical protein